MTKLICSKCQDEMFTASPQIFRGDIHVGCGGKYEVEGMAELRSRINIQNHVAHYLNKGGLKCT